MKKSLLVGIVAGLMSTSAFAFDGTIGAINFAANGNITVPIVGDTETKTYLLVGTGDVRKAMIAALLTAKSTGGQVSAYPGPDENGVYGWNKLILK